MAEATAASAPDLAGLLSRRARDLPSTPRMATDGKSAERIAFSYGFPDPASLPASDVAAATTAVLARAGDRALQYGSTTGVADLIEVLLAKLKRDQGIEAGPRNILITAGGSQALALVLDLLVDWGDAVITEEPTWMGAVRAFANVGAETVTVPVDGEGTDVDALERALVGLRDAGRRAKMIYVISNFQNPSGASTTLERRRRIVELAHEHGTYIFEDDAYHDLRYEGERIPPIYTLDDRGQTMYMGTFSKIMGAGMRLGWLVASPEIITKLAVLKIDGGTNIFGSYVAAEWVPNHLDEHIDRLRVIYRRRRDLMLDALARHMPEGTTWSRPEGGFFLWVTLPEGLDAGRMATQARERGVEFLPGRTCFMGDGGINTLRLSYSFAQDEQIDPGVKVIGEIARGELLELGRSA
ncbi:MAG: Transcriptional regulator, GntR family domain / Aspartate aminotransferase [uncultured Thermomicrobiales bacterium]|uniref:Transcriptional regulator, GntR family domain / Aspartate aminotransferase n=1 Tax=uncultured Thermomicrobiales bacterium TaxID=1645740 RepID=A0A6J4UIT2_9BACT|nr:MAG: Transcriptional regulator, GntR family domain / Aspartate aminotransferase [uncultured Thermomicrobiales bacterium]